MANRWSILAVLFAVRLAMAFQFESVAAVAPLLGSKFDASLADIGVLIGLYFTPGVALALPGGAIAQRFGDKRAVLAALLLMLAGSLVMALVPSWSGQIAGRFAAGAGGVLLNVQLTKMTTDWFAGHEIATAMAILVNSWPAGIALALLSLPLIGTAYGIGAVNAIGERIKRSHDAIGSDAKYRAVTREAIADATLVGGSVKFAVTGLHQRGFGERAIVTAGERVKRGEDAIGRDAKNCAVEVSAAIGSGSVKVALGVE